MSGRRGRISLFFDFSVYNMDDIIDRIAVSPVLVVGAGNIGGAMALGIARGGHEVVLYNRTSSRLDAFRGKENIYCVSDLKAAFVRNPGLVLMCTEGPAVLEILAEVAADIRRCGAVIGSCAAAPTIAQIKQAVAAEISVAKVVRVLPNIAAQQGHSVNLIASENVGGSLLDVILRLIAPTGEPVQIPEQLFPAAMSLSSCGLAFALRYVRATVEAGVELGLSPADATRISAATIAGAAAMLASGEHPEALVDKVTTPGGLTIRGLNAMEEKGFSAAVMAGVRAAAKH